MCVFGILVFSYVFRSSENVFGVFYDAYMCICVSEHENIQTVFFIELKLDLYRFSYKSAIGFGI